MTTPNPPPGINFADELQQLLRDEEPPIADPLTELALANAAMLESVKNSGADIALQIEEIYDIVKDADDNAHELKSAKKRETILLGGLVLLSDLLDGLLNAHFADGQHIGPAMGKWNGIIANCGLEPLGVCGERLDPRFHTVAAAEHNAAPPETVIAVLERGYAYNGGIIRKATVILSKGAAT